MEYFVASVCLLIKYWKNLILHVTQITKTLTESHRNEMNHSLKLFANKEAPHMSSTQKKRHLLNHPAADTISRGCCATLRGVPRCDSFIERASGLQCFAYRQTKPVISTESHRNSLSSVSQVTVRKTGLRQGGKITWENLAESWSFLTQPGNKSLMSLWHRGSKRCKFLWAAKVQSFSTSNYKPNACIFRSSQQERQTVDSMMYVKNVV